MKGEMVYPEWVQEQRVRGTTVKKIGGTYYLYKRTSKRVPGKKYPQPVDTYLGIITPDGVVESKKKKLATASIEVKEYGFSKAVWDSCPDDWKKAVGDRWEEKLACVILKWSPETYNSIINSKIEKWGYFTHFYQKIKMRTKEKTDNGKEGKHSCVKPLRETTLKMARQGLTFFCFSLKYKVYILKRRIRYEEKSNRSHAFCNHGIWSCCMWK